MKLNFKIQIEKEMEIETPSYYKHGYSYLKLIDNVKALYLVGCGYSNPQMQILSDLKFYGTTITNFVEKGEEITAEEFNQAFFDIHNQMAELQLGLTLKATA